jgi:hypothetical protein
VDLAGDHLAVVAFAVVFFAGAAFAVVAVFRAAVDFAAGVALVVAALRAVVAVAVVFFAGVDLVAAAVFLAGAFGAAAAVFLAGAFGAAAVFLAGAFGAAAAPVLRAEAVLVAVFVAGAVVAVDFVVGTVLRVALARLAVAVVLRRVVAPPWAATERFAAPAFAVPVDAADGFAADLVGVADLVPVLVVWLLLAAGWPAARLAAGLVVALSAAAIVSSPLCRRLPLVVGELRRFGRTYASSPSQRASSASQVSLRSRTRSSAFAASSAELYGPSRLTAGHLSSSVSTR